MPNSEIIDKFSKDGYTIKIKDKLILELTKIDVNLFIFENFIPPIDLIETEYKEIQNKFNNFCIKNSVEIMIDDTLINKEKINFLKDNHFNIKYIKYLYEKNLNNHIDLKDPPFEFESLKESGLTEFMEIFEEVLIDDLERDVDTSTYFEMMKDATKDFFFPENWKIIKFNSKKIGILLPQLYPNNPKNGGLSYIGFNKENRNKGYGKLLHSIGLTMLKNIGAEKYIGSTDSRNKAMQKLFEVNDCKNTIKRYFMNFKIT
jgi:hypothetical protein